MDEHEVNPQPAVKKGYFGNKYTNYDGLSFSMKRRRVLIYRATIRSLDSPEYIRFLLNKKEKQLAVQVCEPIDQDNFKVPDLSNMDIQFEISSLNFVSIIYDMMKWNPEGTYRIRGVAVEKYRLVLFDLSKADEISDAEFVDPEAEKHDF